MLSRELGVEAHRPAAWRDDFLEGGKEGLKGQRPDRSGVERALISDSNLLGLIRRVLVASLFAGAWFGHRIGKGDPHVGEQPQRAGQELPIAAALGGRQEDRGVLRQLGGQSLEELPRDLQVEAHRLAPWQDESACVDYYTAEAWAYVANMGTAADPQDPAISQVRIGRVPTEATATYQKAASQC